MRLNARISIVSIKITLLTLICRLLVYNYQALMKLAWDIPHFLKRPFSHQ